MSAQDKYSMKGPVSQDEREPTAHFGTLPLEKARKLTESTRQKNRINRDISLSIPFSAQYLVETQKMQCFT